jgi:hypothetical protein
MSDPVHALYETRAYPAMSHPLSDPAVSSVAALLGGFWKSAVVPAST